MKRLFIITGILFVIIAAFLNGTKQVSAEFFVKERAFVVEETIKLIGLPENAVELRLWIPYPVSDSSQIITDLEITSTLNETIVIDEKYGNKIIYLEKKINELVENVPEVKLSFNVIRKEFSGSVVKTVYEEDMKIFLGSNRTVPVNQEIKELADKITLYKEGEMKKVRAIYDYILEELHYSKDDPSVCGVGDTFVTLGAKKGICTDYHSLFISLVRSLGIPAKFEIGYRIPAGQSEGQLPGYHCWAKFHVKGSGWMPVDISEADKHPEKQDYYFGNIDANRFHLTTGRDIDLENSTNGQALNFFVYPYAEVDNELLTSIALEVKYRDLIDQ